MEQWHASTSGDWEISDRGPDHCIARGRMPRLPITIVWDIRLDAGRIVWAVALECDHETTLDVIEMQLLLPSAYQRWYYGELSGAFPDIRPNDLTWTSVVPPDIACRDVTVLPSPDALVPPVQVTLDASQTYFRLEWLNSDYVLGSRVLNAGARLPQNASSLSPGRHELMMLTLNLGMSTEEATAHAQTPKEFRFVSVGAVTAVFETGFVRIHYEGRELTSFVHLYTSMLIGNLWNGSHDLHWSRPVRTGNRITSSGESRRFRFIQHWELEPTEDGMAFRVTLEAPEPLEVHECHTSIALSPEYSHWETALESGEFAPFDPALDDWRHMNRNYAPGTWVRASSPSLPTVTFEVTGSQPVVRMTALNTGALDRARVLQALRTPDAGALHFAPGRHPYFEGRIRVTVRAACGDVAAPLPNQPLKPAPPK
jgi:hypothetical protein